jgi:ABC-type polar amino acid transport system ATPase subunit
MDEDLRQRAINALTVISLADRTDSYLNSLSGGQNSVVPWRSLDLCLRQALPKQKPLINNYARFF